MQATQSQRATVVLKHVREAADSACRKIVMMRSFEKAGIVPFNPKIVYDSPVCPKMSAEDAATGAAVIDIAQAPVEASNPVQKKRKRSMVSINNRLLTGEEAIQEIREFEQKKWKKDNRRSAGVKIIHPRSPLKQSITVKHRLTPINKIQATI
ncbi:MAG: hypothetical protein AB7K41_16180 [Bdellovibrionales bacterium]